MLVFVFVSGHIVTAGNGISQTGSGLSVRDTMSGSSLQRLKTFDNNITHIKNETSTQIDQKHFEINPFCLSEICLKPWMVDVAMNGSWADNPVTWKYCILWIPNLWKIKNKVRLASKSNNYNGSSVVEVTTSDQKRTKLLLSIFPSKINLVLKRGEWKGKEIHV